MASERPEPHFVAGPAGEWVDPATLRSLDEVKAAKLAEVNAAAEAFVREISGIDKYPEFEQKTWPTQEAEAVAWFAVDEAHRAPALVPWCAHAATRREISLADFMNRVQAKVTAFRTLTADVSGDRQRLEDQIMAATEVSQVDEITINWET
ncbi:hypothetical protein L504_2166 [Bordetella bronchiseptica F2]|uniref:N-acetyltransferase YedL n=2 Tax=Bordetella bronchiseptica TaxID=518 RepID=A0ABR4RDC5_BORBO|nr:hypothetical protein L490_5271 [Bordetella bronchiseptica 00-P-2796]KDC15299.1 hypothetical protein L542_2137 [Bordetella bronchiseptica F-1]KDC29268.1 hypothetical protein L504_2166 [Bordetella bronchiseptica F2]